MTTTRAPCPQCDRGPRDRALSVTTDERGVVSYCHRCGYVATEHIQRPTMYVPRTTASAVPLDWSARAESIWRRTQSLRGTPGETYLQHRGCVLPPADSHVRYLPPTDQHPPSLCAAITDAVTAQPISLHFTRLRADGRGKAGSERDKLLLSGHRKRGGVIRIYPDTDVTYGLAIAEGIETALSAAHIHTPIWAAIDAGNLAAMPVLHGVDALVIYADHDDAGITAARECACRWRDAGREVCIRMPSTRNTDINDIGAAA